MKINENTLARDVCGREGGKLNCSIAQVKEAQKATFDVLAEYVDRGDHCMSEIVALVERHVLLGLPKPLRRKQS